MKNFSKRFASLNYVLRHAESILLIAHNNPDADTVGATVALQEFLFSQGKEVVITCNDIFPSALISLVQTHFYMPDKVDISRYDVVIACDSVERGPFSIFAPKLSGKQVSILVDHHQHIEIPADIRIIDDKRSSTCEILYEFFTQQEKEITVKMATALLLGILFDTGNFQHPCTTTRVLEISSDLLRKGAPLQKIISVVSSNRKMSTLHLWGKAFEKMKIFEKTGMAVTALTQNDFDQYGSDQQETSQIAQTLSTIPGVRYGLVLHQKDKHTVRGSFRAQENAQVDVCSLAKNFGGGGHRLASGFELPGTLIETNGTWIIE